MIDLRFPNARLGGAFLFGAVACWGVLLTAVLPAQEPKSKDEAAGGATLQYPIDVAANATTTYLADRTLPGVWKVEDGKAVLFFRGSKKFRTPLNAIRCLALDAQGRLLAGDSSTRNVYRFDDQGKPQPLLTNRIGVGIPMALAVDSQGRIIIADLELHQIVAVGQAGGEPKKIAAVRAPRGVAVDGEDRIWVVSAGGKDQVVRISQDGETETVVSGQPFRFPHHLALDSEGAAYVADGYGKTIWKIPPGGEPQAWCQGEPLDNPVGLAWTGKLLVADSRATMLFEIDAEGKASPLLKP